MPQRDLVHNLSPVSGLAPAVKSGTSTAFLSSACDCQGFQSVVARFNCGTFGDSQSSSVYIEAEVQDSPDGVTYSPVPNSSLQFPGSQVARTGHATGTFFQSQTTGAADTAGIYEVGYIGPNRYIKVNVRLTGANTVGTPMTVEFSRGNPDYAPAQ